MRILLDTHCWLWMQASPGRFGSRSLELIRSLDNELLLSAASAWEIAIKHALGKLELPAPPREYVPQRMEASGVTGLAVEHAHALRVADLPSHHRDPFDRLLVAQAQIEGLPVLTADPRFAHYEIQILEADR